MVWKLDDSIGKIISALGNKNMLQNTIIVLTTDNGGAVSGYDNSIGSNWPLRGVRFQILLLIFFSLFSTSTKVDFDIIICVAV